MPALQRCVEKITGIGREQFMQGAHVQAARAELFDVSLACRRRTAALVSGHRGGEPFDNRAFAEQLLHLIEKSGVPLAQWNHDRPEFLDRFL
jgi:hypothetical protein